MQITQECYRAVLASTLNPTIWGAVGDVLDALASGGHRRPSNSLTSYVASS